MASLIHSRGYIWFEIVFLCLGLPLLLAFVIPLSLMIPVLWAAALYGYVLWRATSAEPRRLWRWDRVNARNLKPVALRFALAATAVTLFTYFAHPDMLFSFVRERPLFWAFVMIAYPLLSAIPQEVIFRSFFFERYHGIFTSRIALIVASGTVFAATHLIFQNWLAPLLSLAGGLLLARTYDETRSLALVSIEHAGYGCLIFTVGLGRYFYHGAVGAP